MVSSNDERLTRILYETLNSVETHFLATRNFTWEGDDGRTNNGNGRSGCESLRDVGWGVGKVHRAERERFVVVPLKRRYRSENMVTWWGPGFSIGVHQQQPEIAMKTHRKSDWKKGDLIDIASLKRVACKEHRYIRIPFYYCKKTNSVQEPHLG